MEAIKKLKIMSVVGTRPEIIRLSRVLPRMDDYFHHIFVYTNQNYDYELSQIFFEEFSLRRPDYVLNVKADSIGKQMGNIFAQVEEVFIKEKPDALLVLGDTNSGLCAIIAKRLKIPIFHMEAGNRSFDWNVPEEINRRIIDHISDFNLTYTEHSRRYLIREGIAPQNIFVTGSPLTEVYLFFKEKIHSSNILQELHIEPQKYIVVSTHREENIDNENHLKDVVFSLNAIAKQYSLPIIVSLHPRTKKRLEALSISLNENVFLHKPFGYFDYNKLQKNALCVLSDSGSIQEESAIMQFNAIQIRVSTERPEAFDSGSIMVVGFNANSIVNAIEFLINNKMEKIHIPSDYKDENISSKVIKLIMGLTGIKTYHS